MIAWGKLISLSFLAFGLIFLVQISLPLLNFRLLQEKLLSQSESSLISPQNRSKSGILGVSVKTTGEFPAIVSNLTRQSKPNYDNFFLSIPGLDIKDSSVEVDSNDLDRGLAHLPGSGLPGEKGNIFISGHSALPVSFKLSTLFGKNNTPVFSNLSSIKKGDEIFVRAGGTKYTYQVISTKLVKPEDTSVIYPPDSSGRYITLMTCVPPGLNTKRLIVVGKLI